MNLAIVKHIEAGSSDKKYVFLLPDDAIIGNGTLLALETRIGNKIGQLVDRVVADGSALEYILRSFGTDEKHLMPVRGIFIGKTFDELRAEHHESDRRESVECDLREARAKLIEVETELDMLKSKLERLERMLKCCGNW